MFWLVIATAATLVCKVAALEYPITLGIVAVVLLELKRPAAQPIV